MNVCVRASEILHKKKYDKITNSNSHVGLETHEMDKHISRDPFGNVSSLIVN